ncbi:MAG: S1 RNA-binding domain-containing protein [Oscillospiraceae bacterium]|nr:S1 RNA-binding domain-containing protein [Oscillospiraceae bacterium]
MPRTKKTEITDENENMDDFIDADQIELEMPPIETERPQARDHPPPILTIENGSEIETPEDRDNTMWHYIQNAYITRKILTGILGGIEKTENDMTIAVADYRGMRVIIPIDEMMISAKESLTPGERFTRQDKIVKTMLGAEIDFIVKGVDSESRIIVASRRDAVLRKRKKFYIDVDDDGNPKIYDGIIVQARVISVNSRKIRVEAFGVEYTIPKRELSWEWFGETTEKFNIRDRVLVRITEIQINSAEDIRIKADLKSAAEDLRAENLKKCCLQGSYLGKVLNIDGGMVFIRLDLGVNAIAHSCEDPRQLNKKDEVSFVVTRIDTINMVVIGLIAKIVKQYKDMI